MSLLKCGLTTPKIAETDNFWYKFAQKGYTPLSVFYTKFGLGRKSQVRTLVPNFVTVGKKCGSTAPKSPKLIFWYKFAQNGYTPLSDFYNILPGREPQDRTLMPNFTAIALKCGITASKNIAENGNFW